MTLLPFVVLLALYTCFVLGCRAVKIYDSRCLKKTKSKAVSELCGHAAGITSAYFSPCTGNRVLTSCLDDHVRYGWLNIEPCSRWFYFSALAQSLLWFLLTGYMIHLKWPPRLHCWRPSGMSTCATNFLFKGIVNSLPCFNVEPELVCTQPLFLDMTCKPVAGSPSCRRCGTPSRKTALWWGAWWSPAGCRSSMKTGSCSTPSQTQRTSPRCSPSQRFTPRGTPYWLETRQGDCTFLVTEMKTR